jgi:hypothetical protein
VADLDEQELTLHLADPQGTAKALLKKLSARRLLLQLSLPLQELQGAFRADPNWVFSPVSSKTDVNALVATREGLLDRTAGRGSVIDNMTAQKVWADAGGRCMFEMWERSDRDSALDKNRPGGIPGSHRCFRPQRATGFPEGLAPICKRARKHHADVR